jgi:putative FmdB family regulatory protein
MPTYEYRCTKGHTFEVIQSINDAPLTKCQVCGNPVERVLHSPAVHFKGSGFYNTDYGTKKRQREKSASDSSSSDSSSSDSGSSDSGSSSASSDSKPAKTDSKSGGDSTASSAKPKPSTSSD